MVLKQAPTGVKSGLDAGGNPISLAPTSDGGGGSFSSSKTIDPDKEAKESCAARGGKWDPLTRSCILPEPKVTNKEKNKGEYNPEKGGFVSNQGQLYPTTNPDFVPQPTGMNQQNLSPLEFSALKGSLGFESGAGPLTENVKNVLVQTPGTKEYEQAQAVQQQMSFEQDRPIQRDLDPAERPYGNVPILGGLLSTAQNLIAQEALNGTFGEKMRKRFEGRDILEPEQLRTEALTEIERQVYQKGLTASEKFGALIEGIPGGKYLGKWGIIETPAGNIQTLKSTIDKEKGRATEIATLASQGLINPLNAEESIQDIEQNVQRLESRIKMLANYSPQLRFDSDEINLMEVQILRSREVILKAKLIAARGANASPTDVAILQTLTDL
jgi:hypothetical protein